MTADPSGAICGSESRSSDTRSFAVKRRGASAAKAAVDNAAQAKPAATTDFRKRSRSTRPVFHPQEMTPPIAENAGA